MITTIEEEKKKDVEELTSLVNRKTIEEVKEYSDREIAASEIIG